MAKDNDVKERQLISECRQALLERIKENTGPGIIPSPWVVDMVNAWALLWDRTEGGGTHALGYPTPSKSSA